MKSCNKCGEHKLLSEFSKNKARKDGHISICKSCMNNVAKEYRDNNKEKIKLSQAGWRKNNSEYIKNKKAKYYSEYKSSINKKRSEYAKQYYCKNIELYKLANKKYRENNKDKVRAAKAARRFIEKKSSLLWLSDIHKSQILWYYTVAEMFTRQTGIPHEVDHIHPLKGNNFTGLHVPWNLRVIKRSENRSKKNLPLKDESHLFWDHGVIEGDRNA